MVPARPRDTIEAFLEQVARASRIPVVCDRLLIEESYQVDPRYSVEECLGDMMKVLVHAHHGAAAPKPSLLAMTTQ